MGHRKAFAASRIGNCSLPAVLDATLDDVLERACQEQPELPLSEDATTAFVKHLGRSLPDEADPIDWLSSLFAGDYLLAWAAAQAREDALRILARDYVIPACRMAAGAPNRVDELKSDVITHLFVATESAPARITSYSGRGPIGAWLRVVAKRRSIELHRGERPRTAEAEEFARRAFKAVDPELDFLKFRYARQFNAALEEVLRELSTEDANLLHLTTVERVATDAVAQMRHVSARTIQRRLSAIRATVLDELRQKMRDQLNASDDEVESLLGLVQSQLGVTLHRVLARSKPPPNAGS